MGFTWDPSTRFPTEAESLNQVVLNRLRFSVTARVGPAVRDSMNLDVTAVADLAGRDGAHLVARLEAAVFAQDLGERTQSATRDVEWHMPATWVQHWKIAAGARWRVVAWWNRRHPPGMQTVVRKVTTSAVWHEDAGFPRSTILVDPRLGSAVVYVRTGSRKPWSEPSIATYRT